MKLRVSGGLVRCGRCGRRYTNPFSHVCAGRGRSKTRLTPKASASVKCPSCGQLYANPLTHVCPSRRGDFKGRQAADAKRKKAAARKARPQHNYRTCRDEDCQRVACEAYAEGYADGMAAAEED